MSAFFRSMLMDSSQAWYALVDLQESKRDVKNDIHRLCTSLQPLEFESYQDYFDRNIERFEIVPGVEFDVDSAVVSENDALDDDIDAVEDSYDSISSTNSSSESDSESDDETFTQRLTRLQQRTPNKKKKTWDTSRNKNRYKPYNAIIEENRRRSTRVFIRNANNNIVNQINNHHNININILKANKYSHSVNRLKESIVNKVRRPFRKSDRTLRVSEKFKPEEEFTEMPMVRLVSMRTLLATDKFKNMLDKLEDEE